MTSTAALRALADHIDRHPHLVERLLQATTMGVHATETPKLILHGAGRAVARLLDAYATLDEAWWVTAELFQDSVFLFAHGLSNGHPMVVQTHANGAEADLLRSNFKLTDTPTEIDVDRLHALVSAEAAEDVERPIVDPALIGGTR